MKKRKIYKNKNYTHFDSRKPEYWKYLNSIRNPKWIERHAFYPFIYYKEGRNKFNGEEIIPKSRDIRYSSHIDRYIYEYYNDILSKKYNKYAKQLGINQAVIAYRTNLNKNNIHFSRDVFKFLKDRLKEILKVDTLPNDYYKIFKSITKYSYIEYNDILNELHLKHKELTKLHKERLFDIEQFRKFKQGKVHGNKESYGMVQGSAISSVMSNIYMIKFDKLVNDIVTSNNGIYRRYSDDIIIIIPNIAGVKELYNKIMNIKDKIPNLIMSPEKTSCFIKRQDSITSVDILKNKVLKENTIINYLGFSYDGECVKIREKTVAKYYRKMYARIKTINRWTVKTGNNIGRKKLYKQYSYLGKRTKDIKKGNFLTYVDRSKKEYGDLGRMEEQVKNSWKYMSKRLVKIKK